MYQQHAVNFIEHKGMTLSMKVMILTFASTMLMFPLYFSKSIILKNVHHVADGRQIYILHILFEYS